MRYRRNRSTREVPHIQTKKFVEIFLQELRDRGVDDKEIKHKKYKKYLGKLVSDRDIKELIKKSCESSFVFCHNLSDRIEQVWTQKYQPSGVPFPAAFNWDLLILKYQVAVAKRQMEVLEAHTKAHNRSDSYS